MRQLFILFFFVSLFPQSIIAQSFQKTYGNSESDGANTVIVVDDGYLMAGFTTNKGNKDALLLKTDIQGNTIWANSYGEVGEDFLRSVISTNDGGFIAVGEVDEDILVIKTDENGNLEWSKAFGGNQNDRGFSILQNGDNSYIVAGSTMSYGEGHFDIFITKLSENGDLMWSKVYGGFANDSAFDIQHSTDNGYIVSGVLDSTSGDVDILLMKIDAEGEPFWIRSIGDNAETHGRSVINTSDGGYLVLGHTLSCSNSTYRSIAVKLNGQGETEWSNVYEDGFAVNTLELPQGGYLLMDYFRDASNGNRRNNRLTRIDANGAVLTSTIYGGEGDDAAPFAPSNGLQLVNEQEVVFAVQTSSYGAGEEDAQLIIDNIFSPQNCTMESTNSTPSNCPVDNELTNLLVSTITPSTTSMDISAVALSFATEDICCPSTSLMGEVDNELQIICGDDASTADNINHTGFTLNDEDVGAFVLHTNSDDVLGTILAMNFNGNFSLTDNENISPNTIYYLSPIVGIENDTTGLPNVEDDCIRLAAGTPIVFLAPITFALDEICDVNTGDYLVSVQLTGGYPAYDNTLSYEVSGDFEAAIGFNEVFTVVFAGGSNNDGFTFNIADDCGEALIQGEPFDCTKNAVTLLEFQGEIQANGNLLQWMTASESNSKYFTLSRSQDGKNYEKIGEVNSIGDSQDLQTYTYLDTAPTNGLTYYQLQETDLNGLVETLASISLQRNMQDGLRIQKVYPVPSKRNVTLQFVATNTDLLQLEIVNTNGQLVYREKRTPQNDGFNEWTIDVSEWKSGVYVLKLQSGEEVVVSEFIVE